METREKEKERKERRLEKIRFQPR